MDVLPFRIAKRTGELFSQVHLRRIINLERDIVASADTLASYSINDMVDHFTALKILKERFELSRLHLLSLQRCNKQSQIARMGNSSNFRLKSIAMTLDGFHINSWLLRISKLMVNVLRFPDIYMLEKEALQESIYKLLLTLDPRDFFQEEYFFMWILAAQASSWSNVEAMVEHFALRDALDTLTAEQFAELLIVLCTTRFNALTPKDAETYALLRAPYVNEDEPMHVRVQRRLKQAELQAMQFDCKACMTHPSKLETCATDKDERFLHHHSFMLANGLRIIREIIGEKYVWERCIEVLRDTSMDAMFARSRIFSVLPVVATATHFWPAVELMPTVTETHETDSTQTKALDKSTTITTTTTTTTTSSSTSSSGIITTNNINGENLEGAENANNNNNKLTEKSEKVNHFSSLFYYPVVMGKPEMGAQLYSELPWLFDEKSWRSYFPREGPNALLQEIYAGNLSQFALRVICMYNNNNQPIPDYVRETYEKPFENNLWRHINERDIDTVGTFVLFSYERYNLIYAPFEFTRQMAKFIEHVVRDRWGVVLSNADNEKSNTTGNSKPTVLTESHEGSTCTINIADNNSNDKSSIEDATVNVSDHVETSHMTSNNNETENEEEIGMEANLENKYDETDNHDKRKHNSDKNTTTTTTTISNNNSNNEIVKDADVEQRAKEVKTNLTNIKKMKNDMQMEEEEEELEQQESVNYEHGSRARELREKRTALRRLSRSSTHLILKTLLFAAESRCSEHVIKPLMQTLIRSLQQILTPSVCNKWNLLYNKRKTLALNAKSIDWLTIERLLQQNECSEKGKMNEMMTNTEQSTQKNNTHKNDGDNYNNNYNFNSETHNNTIYASNERYDRAIELEWSLWPVANTAYTLTTIETCFHGQPIFPLDIRCTFYQKDGVFACDSINSSNTTTTTNNNTNNSDNSIKENLYSRQPLFDIEHDAEAAEMKAQLTKMCVAALHGAIATDRLTARSLHALIVCAPQTLRETQMMYELLSLAALNANNGFNRTQLLSLVHADHVFEADEQWRQHMLKAALSIPLRMWI